MKSFFLVFWVFIFLHNANAEIENPELIRISAEEVIERFGVVYTKSSFNKFSGTVIQYKLDKGEEKIFLETEYTEGLKDGWRTEYYRNGAIESEMKYINNNIVWYMQYTGDGKPWNMSCMDDLGNLIYQYHRNSKTGVEEYRSRKYPDREVKDPIDYREWTSSPEKPLDFDQICRLN